MSELIHKMGNILQCNFYLSIIEIVKGATEPKSVQSKFRKKNIVFSGAIPNIEVIRPERRHEMSKVLFQKQEMEQERAVPRRPFYRTFKGVVRMVAGMAVLLLVIIAAFFIGERVQKQKEPTYIDAETVVFDDPDMIIEAKDHTVTVQNVIEVLAPASDLISTKYYYTDADTFEDFKDINGWKLPFTTNKTVFVYDGVISAGVRLSEVTFDVDNENRVITVYMPDVEVLSHEIDMGSFQYYDVSKSVFNSTEMEEVTELFDELKQKEEEKFTGREVYMEQAKINAQTVISSFLRASEETKDFMVVFA